MYCVLDGVCVCVCVCVIGEGASGEESSHLVLVVLEVVYGQRMCVMAMRLSRINDVHPCASFAFF